MFGAVQSLSEVPAVKPRPLLFFYRGEYTGIEPDKTTPAQWRDDLGRSSPPPRRTPGYSCSSMNSTIAAPPRRAWCR